MNGKSYPAIALLVSVFIMISFFALYYVGYNNYLEKQREYGKDIMLEFLNYNVLQYYLYVLSDYEVRKSFFSAIYDLYDSSINNGYLDVNKLNDKIISNGYLCKDFVDYYAIGDVLVIYPCISPMPISNFSDYLKKDFVSYLAKNFNPEKNIKNISDFYGVDIKLLDKGLYIDNGNFSLYQVVNYSYTSDFYTRRLNLVVNYTLIPYVFVYNQLLAEEYKDYYLNYINFLKNLYKNPSNLISSYGSLYNLLTSIITTSKIVNNYVILIRNEEKSLNKLRNFFSIYLIDKDRIGDIKVIEGLPILCEQFGRYEMSSGDISYEEIKGCNITVLSNNYKHKYKYGIEECLLPTDYYRNGDLNEINNIYAEINFYVLNLTEPNLISLSGILTFIGTNNNTPDDVNKNYTEHLWTVNGKYNPLSLYEIGKFYLAKCVLGEVHNELKFTDKQDCEEVASIVRRSTFADIIKDCTYESNQYVLEWIERIRNITVYPNDIKMRLAIYWPYYDNETLKYLISS